MEIYEFICLMEDLVYSKDTKTSERALKKIAEEYDGDLRVFILHFGKTY